MKLSEAIRLGAMMGPQEFGPYRRRGACALQSALMAVGHELGSMTYGPSKGIWPWLDHLTACPKCGVRGCVAAMVVCLNDNHHWTREQIADWVATVEPAEVHASETNGQCSLGKGPIGPSLEEINAVTITKQNFLKLE